jgi:glycosyltransferase involved in cell wall biosynthesis
LNENKQFSIIPAYEPEKELTILVNQLVIELPDLEIVIINDGSNSQNSTTILEQLDEKPAVTVINHTRNKGKGAALKTGFRYVLNQNLTNGSVVTADADGQHLASDIIKVLNELKKTSLPILGVRSFDKETPIRSLFGNKITSFIYKILSGKTLIDTQTGLRAFPVRNLTDLIKISGDRYDYEMRQLTDFWQKTLYREIPITTVYQPNNPTSHFHPFLDSMKIYWVLLRHLLVTPLIGIIDFIILYSAIYMGLSAIIAVTASRAISGIFYFLAIKHSVFKVTVTSTSMIIKFALNIGFNILLFPIIYNELKYKNDDTLLPVITTYSILYLFNFLFQKFVVFSQPRKNHE